MGQLQSALAVLRQQYSPFGALTAAPAAVPLDRDLSLIEFYRRVLEEACDETNPLLERVKFLGIVVSGIDEFVVTRYAELIAAGRESDRASRTPHQQRVKTEITDLRNDAQLYLVDALTPALAKEGVHLVHGAELQSKERAEVESYFTESVLPLLMPLGFDAAKPFPHVTGRTLALAVIVRNSDKQRFACIQLPEALPAFAPFHWRRLAADGAAAHAALEQGFVWLADVIADNLAAVFPGMEIADVHPFRVFRDANLDTESSVDSQQSSVADAVAQGLHRREFGDVIGLMVGETMPASLVDMLAKNLGIAPAAVHTSRQMRDLARLTELSRIARPDLHDPPLVPRIRSTEPASFGEAGEDIFASIRRGDILLHHPYDSFQPVIDLIERAAADPAVLAISTTLYRTSRHSRIVEALLDARRAGKQVRVIVELRARFDEENNIVWSRALQDAGVHVLYGLAELKVHAKLTLIVRREAGTLRRYVHLSSGNYNPATSTVYTDLGLFSCSDNLGSDTTALFNALTGYGSPSDFHTLLVAPVNLRKRLNELIEREASWAGQGYPSHMILKINALGDEDVIENLCLASQAGARVDLVVRGICCLRPGIPGVSDNIRVRSIVGRFLEHSRIWYFSNGGREEIYLGSADLMPRNLDERVEVMTRLEDGRLKRRVRDEILGACLADNVKARELNADGSYRRVVREPSEPAINSQECLL